MSKRRCARKPQTEGEYLRREIEVLEALRRRGGITLVMADDQLITAYTNDRKVFR
jgi:hypothetical protein